MQGSRHQADYHSNYFLNFEQESGTYFQHSTGL